MAATQFVTDGGLETDLIYHHGFDLPEFAAFPLLDDERGRATLADYYAGYAAIAAGHGVGLQLEAPTWRASPDWGARLGYDAAALAAVNTAAVGFLRDVAGEWSDRVPDIRVSGQVGPRGDGYVPGAAVDPDEAAAYHQPQVTAFAEAGADLVSALTLSDVGEAVGVVRAAREAGVPVLVSFTVETDGRLPTGLTLAEAIVATDAAAAPDAFMINCAYPDHVAPRPRRRRTLGARARTAGQRLRPQPRGARRDDRARRRGPRGARGLPTPGSRSCSRRSASSAAAAAPTPVTSRPSGRHGLRCAGDPDPHPDPADPPGLVGRRGDHGGARRRGRVPLLDRGAAGTAGGGVRLVACHHQRRGQPQPRRLRTRQRRSRPR